MHSNEVQGRLVVKISPLSPQLLGDCIPFLKRIFKKKSDNADAQKDRSMNAVLKFTLYFGFLFEFSQHEQENKILLLSNGQTLQHIQVNVFTWPHRFLRQLNYRHELLGFGSSYYVFPLYSQRSPTNSGQKCQASKPRT